MNPELVFITRQNISWKCPSPPDLRTSSDCLCPWPRILPSTSCCTPETSPATSRWWKGGWSFNHGLVSELELLAMWQWWLWWCCCRYYADIRQTISASDQEMNSALAELSRVGPVRCHPPPEVIRRRAELTWFSVFQNYSGELNYLVALHELYKYINKYYDQVGVSPGSHASDPMSAGTRLLFHAFFMFIGLFISF